MDVMNQEPNNNEINNQNQNIKRKKKLRKFRLWEMTSDPKSFSLLMFLVLFFVSTSYFCLSDVMQQRRERKMEISKLWQEKSVFKKKKKNTNDNQSRKKKKKKKKKKKSKIFTTSLRQAIKKEKSL